MEVLETDHQNKSVIEFSYGKYSRDATEKLEAARCLTTESIHIFQDNIFTTNNENTKYSQWRENVIGPLLKIVDLFAVSMKSFEDILQIQENSIEFERNDKSSNIIVKSEYEKSPIKNDPLESYDELSENYIKDDIEMHVDNLKFEQFDDIDETSLDFTPFFVKNSEDTGLQKGKRTKKKTKPPKMKGPGYCEDCKKEHIDHVAEGEKKEYPCNLCEKSYKCIRYLKVHEKLHSEKFKCEFCGVSVTTKDALERHINNKHKGPYPCEICGKLFSSIKALGLHKSHHGKIKPTKKIEIFQCSLCEKEFKGKFRLKEHMNCHSSEKPHTCDICGASFSHKEYFIRHRKIHSEEEPYSCDICGKAFKLAQYLAIHKKTHNTDITFNCDLCDKSFSSNSGLIKHKKVHTGDGQFECALCDKTFIYKYRLTRHERTHSGVKPFHCEACNMSFYSNGELVKHKKLSIRHADNMKKVEGSNNEIVDELKNENAD